MFPQIQINQAALLLLDNTTCEDVDYYSVKDLDCISYEASNGGSITAFCGTFVVNWSQFPLRSRQLILATG